MNCRSCGHPLNQIFIDLGCAPPSNSFLSLEDLDKPETHYPLKLFVCGNCFLVQIDEYKLSSEIFSEDYVYFSSFSSTWREHARHFADSIIERLGLSRQSLVIEIASNDGYLLEHFKSHSIPCLGIEPSLKTAWACMGKGIEVLTQFFGTSLARDLAHQGRQADLIVANNVLAHVPAVNDFVAGIATCLKEEGVATLEFPHLLRLMEGGQFDTIYHEHYSYFSLSAVITLFEANGLRVHDVEELSTHGGSLRLHASRAERSVQASPEVDRLLKVEETAGMHSLESYKGFQAKADRIKLDVLSFLVQARRQGRTVAGYGAAAKGNTLLNYCGVRSDLVRFVADASPYKQGKFLPGSRIPVVSPEELYRQKPDYVLVLPWNILPEIQRQLAGIRKWGGRFITAVSCPHCANEHDMLIP